MQSTIEVLPDGIVYTKLKASNDSDEIMEWVFSLKKVIKEIYERTGKKALVLTDLSEAVLPKDFLARELIIKMEKEDVSYVERSAAFGADLQLKAAANVIAALSGRDNFQTFNNKEAAIRWLKS